MDTETLEKALEAETGLDWTGGQRGVALYTFYCAPYKVTVEARNPKEDTTWRLMIENEGDNEDAAIGPVDTDSVETELKELVRRFL